MNKVHVVYAAPRREGFVFSCLELILSRLKNLGAHVEFLDLYRCGFDPVLREDDLQHCYSKGVTPGELTGLTNSLAQATTIIFVFPVWMYSMPAILKGYFDKVWRPGVSFAVENDVIRPLLCKLDNIMVVCTAGQADSASENSTPDLTKSFFEQLAAQNTTGPAAVHYVKFGGRDAVSSDAECTVKEVKIIEELLRNVLA